MMKTRTGQALTEFVILIPGVLVVGFALAVLARAQWERARCAYQVFSAVHDRLYGNSLTAIRHRVILSESETHITGWSKCSDTVQKVSLEKI